MNVYLQQMVGDYFQRQNLCWAWFPSLNALGFPLSNLDRPNHASREQTDICLLLNKEFEHSLSTILSTLVTKECEPKTKVVTKGYVWDFENILLYFSILVAKFIELCPSFYWVTDICLRQFSNFYNVMPARAAVLLNFRLSALKTQVFFFYLK